MPTEELDTDDLEQLERIVPEDISDWPPFAQVLYLQTRQLTKQVAGLQKAIRGKDGLAEVVSDHEKRIRFLEAVVRWLAGIGTAALTAVAIAATLAITIWRKTP